MASLRDMGLSEYEERAYRALLDAGATTAKELSRASGVPMGRIYDVLNSLEQHRLVRSQTASRPKRYRVVEPPTAVDRLLEAKKEELAEKADQYEEIAETLKAELDAVEPVEDQFWTAALGAEETVDLLVERLANAHEQLVMVASRPSPQVDLGEVGDRVAEELRAALDRGVGVSLLVAPDLVDELPESVGRLYTRSLADRESFAVRTYPEVHSTFNVIDDKEVCIQVPNPLDASQAFAMIDLKDPEFATDVTEEFRPRWENAEPLSI